MRPASIGTVAVRIIAVMALAFVAGPAAEGTVPAPPADVRTPKSVLAPREPPPGLHLESIASPEGGDDVVVYGEAGNVLHGRLLVAINQVSGDWAGSLPEGGRKLDGGRPGRRSAARAPTGGSPGRSGGSAPRSRSSMASWDAGCRIASS
ncbi:hypothetical protein [Nonomuraea sp. SYSU D8015]|uniref:hypothetical protein n=1 Tax=Nonomuraea sp. SYSU D8015 TaxID=2593644 RepID=UPI001660C313|nr:hypothetical protein [Nonomuraea sp. SYSU D8015]